MKHTQSYSLDEEHIATIKAVAKDHGDGSASAALRYIIDEYVRMLRETTQRPAPQAPPAAGEEEE